MVVVLGLGRRLNVCWKVPLSSCSLQESLQNTSGLSRKKEKAARILPAVGPASTTLYIHILRIHQNHTWTGMGGLRERNLMCDYGSEVLAICPRGKAPANSGNKCDEKKRAHLYVHIAAA